VRVLVVSENPAERSRAASMLRPRADVEIIEVATAAAAKAALVAGGVDVAVVDGNLAPQGGYSFLYEAQQEAELHGVSTPPAIVLTSRPEDSWLAGWASAAATLPLPADPFAVARTVDELLAARP
jgi:CheY-like chemotaxis protein